jgi:hypothetical protein
MSQEYISYNNAQSQFTFSSSSDEDAIDYALNRWDNECDYQLPISVCRVYREPYSEYEIYNTTN